MDKHDRWRADNDEGKECRKAIVNHERADARPGVINERQRLRAPMAYH